MRHLAKHFLVVGLAVSAFVLIGQNAHGKERRHHRHVDSNGNPIGRFTCGLTQRLHFGLPSSFNVALHWATLPHTNAAPGAVVVQRRRGRALGGGPGGHVSRIVELKSACRALVTDEKGTYERDICKNLVAYVRPNGIGFSARTTDSHARQETVTQ